MSDPITLSQPPLAASASHPSLPSADALAAIEGAAKRLRDELAQAQDRDRQARLLDEIADLEDRAGDEASAARDYLAAFNADPSFREPLESLLAILEKRRSWQNVGKLLDTLVRSSASPDERVRALLMRAAFQADHAGDLAEAKAWAREATGIEGAPAAEAASAWLALEVIAGRAKDPAARQEALAERTNHAHDPTWRALLLIDRARMQAASGDVGGAIAMLDQARALESAATWAATVLLERIAHDPPAIAGTDEARTRAEVRAAALEAIATMVHEATSDGARGDALGVPQWARQPAHMVDASLRAAEARRALGRLDIAAETIERAMDVVAGIENDEARFAERVLSNARIRIAEQLGDTAVAARLAEQRLATEKDAPLAAALAMRVAEHAASQADGARVLQTLSRAIASDPGCLPARALQLDALADGDDPSAFAAQLESFADHLATDAARGRAFVLAAYVWGARVKDVPSAKAALSQAAMYGVAPATAARVARLLASISGDTAWYEEATARLLAAGGAAVDEDEAISLAVEVIRLRRARGDAEGADRALRDLARTPKGAWLSLVLEAFADRSGSRDAVEKLAAIEADAGVARGLALVAATRSHAAGDIPAALERLRDLAARDASDVLVATYLADVERAAGDHASAARVVADAAAATTDDPELCAALRLEAGFERWREGDVRGALEEIEAAAEGAPEAAKLVLGWASRGVDPDSIESRRRAIERALEAGGDARVLALERFATEAGGGDPAEAAAALAAIDRGAHGEVGVAAAIARLAWSPGANDGEAMRAAIDRIGSLGTRARLFATTEQVRVARDSGNARHAARAAREWFQAGGGLAAAIEWLGAAMASGAAAEEHDARAAAAGSLDGEAREQLLASAAMIEARLGGSAALVVGPSHATQLANIELAPPGCDPRRRAAALTEIDGALGEDAALDAAALAGWSALAAGDFRAATTIFESTSAARPGDLAAWEGLRACAEASADKALRARAASELGARCADDPRGAAFWEEAALLWLDLGDDENADRALAASVERDPKRAVAFDRLFRRVRDRKDNDKLLSLVSRRLEATDDPQEIQKLFWEQARTLREKGDQEGALKALEHVTMVDPDHVGALALLGEINIRRGHFAEAATHLARLASLETAPAKNRVTAGIAAVDLYENKLDRFDKALDVLIVLHKAKLSTLPVRERLARAAARTGAWKEAVAILEELMHERPSSEGRIEAARLAMALHRDRLSNQNGAARAIVKLLEESPTDGEGVDMLLTTEHAPETRERLLHAARDALLEILQKRPCDLTAVRRLAKVARALPDEALQHAALGVVAALSVGDPQIEGALSALAARKTQTPQVEISAPILRAILAPGDDGPVADLFAMLGPTVAEALGPNLQGCGVSKRDRIDPRSGVALRNEIAAWAGAFGIREIDLYVGGKDPHSVQGVPGEPPALIVGAGVKAPLGPLARARVARELLAIVRGSTIALSRDDTSIAAIAVAACRLAEVPIEHPPYAVLGEIERLMSKAMSRRTRKAIVEAGRAVAARNADARNWQRRALASHDRIAAIAAGDVSLVLGEALGVPERDRLAEAVKGNARGQELLGFVLSAQYIDVRRALGLEGASP